jgi:hypothetical protein
MKFGKAARESKRLEDMNSLAVFNGPGVHNAEVG